MSRTRNTRPYKARKEVYVAHHDHRNGECGLPPLDEYLKQDNNRRRGHLRTECTWWPEWTKVRDTRCSCNLCRDPWSHDQAQKEEARRYPKDLSEY